MCTPFMLLVWGADKGANQHTITAIYRAVFFMTEIYQVYEGGQWQMETALNINTEHGVAAALEAKRLAEKYGKDFLTCEDIVKITGFGTNNVRQLMCSDAFPYVHVGNRKAISVIAFALWSLKAGRAS